MGLGLPAQGKDPHAAAGLVGDDQGAGFQANGVAGQQFDYHRFQILRAHPLRPDLDHAGPLGLRRGQDGPEVQVVGEDDMVIGLGPLQDLGVGGVEGADRRPMPDGVPMPLQHFNPAGRQVHVDEYLEVHQDCRVSSISSDRQEA